MALLPEWALTILSNAIRPDDEYYRESWLGLYGYLFRMARAINPRRIVEIGTRRGYSALAFCLACPEALVLTIDADLDEHAGHNTHGGMHGAWKVAREILAGRQALILLVNSHDLIRLPDADLVFVDAEHTQEGCFDDLILAAQSATHILVDDYASKDAHGVSLGVPEACAEFAIERPDFRGRAPFGGAVDRLYLFSRRDAKEIDENHC